MPPALCCSTEPRLHFQRLEAEAAQPSWARSSQPGCPELRLQNPGPAASLSCPLTGVRPGQVPALPRPQTRHTRSSWGHRKMRTGLCQHLVGHKAHASSWELLAHCRHYCRYADNSEEGASLSRVALKTLLPCGWGHSCVWGAHPLETNQQSRPPARISTFSPGDLAKQEGLRCGQPDSSRAGSTWAPVMPALRTPGTRTLHTCTHLSRVSCFTERGPVHAAAGTAPARGK